MDMKLHHTLMVAFTKTEYSFGPNRTSRIGDAHEAFKLFFLRQTGRATQMSLISFSREMKVLFPELQINRETFGRMYDGFGLEKSVVKAIASAHRKEADARYSDKKALRKAPTRSVEQHGIDARNHQLDKEFLQRIPPGKECTMKHLKYLRSKNLLRYRFDATNNLDIAGSIVDNSLL